MNVPQIDNSKLLWYVIFHLTFVVSALLFGYLDKIAFAAHREHGRDDAEGRAMVP